MNEIDRELLLDMHEYASAAIRILGAIEDDAFARDETRYLAVTYAVQVVGEAASKLSSECRAEFPEIAWQNAITMRHKLVHG